MANSFVTGRGAIEYQTTDNEFPENMAYKHIGYFLCIFCFDFLMYLPTFCRYNCNDKSGIFHDVTWEFSKMGNAILFKS